MIHQCRQILKTVIYLAIAIVLLFGSCKGKSESEKAKPREPIDVEDAGPYDFAPYFTTVSRAEASSFLTEGSTEYAPQNLTRSFNDIPWVEGADGSGVGESITLFFQTSVDALEIRNGFVSMGKPNLFKENGRVEQFLATYTNTAGVEVEQLYNLPDTTNALILYLEGEVDEITLTINSVYEGSTNHGKHQKYGQ